MKEAINNKESVGLSGQVYKVKTVQYDVLEKHGQVYSTEADDRDTWPLDRTDTYNEEGIRIEEDSKHRKESMVITFDKQGFQVERNDYLEDGSLKYKYIRTNNKDGKVTQDTGFNRAGDKTDRTTWEYNEEGKIIKYVSYDKDEKITTLINCSYWVENNINWSENKHFDGEGKFKNCIRTTHNSKGQTVEEITLNEVGSIKETKSYADKYDSEDNWIEPVSNRNNKALYKTIVDNDHHGNWTIKIDYFNNKPIYIHKRTILYFGEKEIDKPIANKFETPIKLKNPVTIETVDRTISDYKYELYKFDSDTDLNLNQAKWLAEKSTQAEHFPYLAYYMLHNTEIPSQLVYTGSNVEVIAFLKQLTANEGAEIVHSYYMNSNNKGEVLIRYTLSFRENRAYLIHITQIQESDSEEYIIPEFMEEYGIGDDGLVRTSQIILLYPGSALDKRDEYGLESNINTYIEWCALEEIPEKPEIFMVEVMNNTFNLESHYINDDFEIKELDVNYGFGFEQFHNELIQRFTKEHKGLVLFHGIPGTGKTYYIRHLLREMAIANKIVIYMPPNMVDYLSEPEFMTFLSKTVADYSSRNLTCVLLIEDAEPLLVARHNEGRVQGITNLLNMSDGLLNDMLKLQIICTFNCELKQLDSALLRPGRLIARKEFKALPELEANILAQRLGVKYHFEEPATLSEIYAKIKNQNTIIHEE